MDDTGFEELYAATWREILGYALRRTTDAEDAADIVAEVFTVAWRRRPDIPPGSQGRLWLYGVARFTLANQRRGEVRRGHLATALRAAIRTASADPAAVVLSRWEADAVLAGLRELPEVERDLLTLIAWEGLSPADAAAVVGLRPASARVRLHRARAKLKKLLDEPAQQHRRSGQGRSDGHLPVPVREQL